MSDFGGCSPLKCVVGAIEAFAMTSRLKLIVRATSLGGTHSLIEHRASIEGVFSRSPESLLRLSVGLECAEDLIADLIRHFALGGRPGRTHLPDLGDRRWLSAYCAVGW